LYSENYSAGLWFCHQLIFFLKDNGWHITAYLTCITGAVDEGIACNILPLLQAGMI
jgi:hypothetical protein